MIRTKAVFSRIVIRMNSKNIDVTVLKQWKLMYRYEFHERELRQWLCGDLDSIRVKKSGLYLLNDVTNEKLLLEVVAKHVKVPNLAKRASDNAGLAGKFMHKFKMGKPNAPDSMVSAIVGESDYPTNLAVAKPDAHGIDTGATPEVSPNLLRNCTDSQLVSSKLFGTSSSVAAAKPSPCMNQDTKVPKSATQPSRLMQDVSPREDFTMQKADDDEPLAPSVHPINRVLRPFNHDVVEEVLQEFPYLYGGNIALDYLKEDKNLG